MSRKKSINTLVAIVDAFHRQPVWPQKNLADRLGVHVDTLKNTLFAMSDEGWPFVREEDPPQVYWSLPSDFFAGGVLLPLEDAVEAVRHLSRSPPSAGRDRLIERLVRCAPESTRTRPAAAHHPSTIAAESEHILDRVEDAVAKRQALEVKYFTNNRGVFEWRTISFQSVVQTTPVRLAGWCHNDDKLKWFRLDNIASYRDTDGAFVSREHEDLDTFLTTSFDGFHEGGAATKVEFFVREPEARWVRVNLLPPLTHRDVENGIVVEGETAGLRRVAQFVVGLGDAARPASLELAAAVRELAAGALASAGSGGEVG